MGKLTSIALGIMVAFSLVALMASAMYTASTDANKTAFSTYAQYNNFSELNAQNMSYANTNNSVSNMQLAAENIAEKIAGASRDLNSDNPVDKIVGAFGLISALTIDVVVLLLAILMDGVNFIGGIIANIGSLPTPWREFGTLSGLGVGMFIVYTVFKIASAALKVDI